MLKLRNVFLRYRLKSLRSRIGIYYTRKHMQQTFWSITLVFDNLQKCILQNTMAFMLWKKLRLIQIGFLSVISIGVNEMFIINIFNHFFFQILQILYPQIMLWYLKLIWLRKFNIFVYNCDIYITSYDMFISKT